MKLVVLKKKNQTKQTKQNQQTLVAQERMGISGGSRHSIWGGGGGGHEMRQNAKGTVGNFGGRKLI